MTQAHILVYPLSRIIISLLSSKWGAQWVVFRQRGSIFSGKLTILLSLSRVSLPFTERRGDNSPFLRRPRAPVLGNLRSGLGKAKCVYGARDRLLRRRRHRRLFSPSHTFRGLRLSVCVFVADGAADAATARLLLPSSVDDDASREREEGRL